MSDDDKTPVDKRPQQLAGRPEFEGPGVPEMLGLPQVPFPVCGAPIRTRDGTVVATCNLSKGHLPKCAEVDWAVACGPWDPNAK